MEVPLPRAVSCLDPMLGLPAMIRAHDGLWRLPGLAVPVAYSRRQGPPRRGGVPAPPGATHPAAGPPGAAPRRGPLT